MRYVGSIERGAVSASVSVLGKVAEALGVDPCDLIRAQSADDRHAEIPRQRDF
jgi:transcriptional regulator with XRE-family HTH domain